MSYFLKLLENGVYPQFLFSPDDGDNGGNSGGDGDDKSNDDDNGGDDKSGDKMINLDDIKGKENDNADDKDDADDKDKDGQDDKDKDKKAERPDDIPEKFWDPEKGEIRAEAMAKAYKDLESKLGNNKKAPDEYKIELNEDLEKMFDKDKADDDPILSWFKEYAKENNFSQEMFNEALAGFGEKAGELLTAAEGDKIDPAVEKEKLGKNSEAIIKNQMEFLSGMYKNGAINEEQAQEILILTETAPGIQALQAIRNHYGDSQKIPMNLNPGGGVKSADELRSMQANDKYGNDPEYTSTVDKEYEKKYGAGNSGESQRSAL